MEYVTLNNNIKMPVMGYCVYQISPKETQQCVLDAIAQGYRMIDTAQVYDNEEAVGNAVNICGVPREQLFLTTKIWISNAGYEKAKISIEESLRRLQTDYIDMLLIHQPFGDYYGTYRAMEEAYKEGWVRAIGVSNFCPDRLIDLCWFAEIVPAVDQIETHVFNQQKTAKAYMKKYRVQHEALSPLAEGRRDFLLNPVMLAIGEKYQKSASQIALRYLIQNGIVVIPKSVHKKRMIENMSVFDFRLDDSDMKKIATLDEDKNDALIHFDPLLVEHFPDLEKSVK